MTKKKNVDDYFNSTKNIYNDRLMINICHNMNMEVIEYGNRFVIVHEAEDWDLITILAQRLMLVAERWMSNQEPRTTVYKASKAFRSN